MHVIGDIYSFVCVCECVCLFMGVYSVVPLQDHLRWCSLRLADCSDTHSDCRRKIGYVWVWWEAQHLIEILHATHDKRGWGLLYVAADKPEIARSVAVDNGKILESVTRITNAFLCIYIDKHHCYFATSSCSNFSVYASWRTIPEGTWVTGDWMAYWGHGACMTKKEIMSI